MKQEKKALASPFGSIHGEEIDEGSNLVESSSEEEPKKTKKVKKNLIQF